MLHFNSLHILGFLFLFHINIVIRAFSEPKIANELSYAGIQHESILEVAIRNKREDAWNPNDIFLCEEDDRNSMGYSLSCNKIYICKMTMFSPTGIRVFEEILDLDTLTDNCSQPFNPFYTTQSGLRTRHPNLPFVITQSNISELEFWYTNFTHFPPHYFCKLTNTKILTFQYNLFKGSIDLGLTTQCDMPQCCLCWLEKLDLSRNKMEVVNNFSFCGLSSLMSLTLANNVISQVDVNAFATLQNLEDLDLSYNSLRSFPENTFLQVRNLKMLNLEKNLLTETSLECFHWLSSLEEINLSNNEISQIKNGTFSNLKSLKKLYLRKNNLLHLRNVISFLDNLIVLDISANLLSNTTELDLSSMTNLSRLYLNSNKFTSITTLFFSEYAHMNVLDLSGNKLTSIPKFLFLKHVGLINLSMNNIRKITAKDKDMFCNITFVGSIDLNSNLIDNIVPDAFHCNGDGNGLKILNLIHNRISNISHIFGQNKLEKLLLNENRIESLSLADVSPSIVILDVTKNIISNFSGIHRNDAYSNKHVSMKKLILESNKISKISNVYFPQTLELLHLGSNKLVNFSVTTIRNNISASIILPENIKTVDITFNGFEYVCSVIYAFLVNDNMPVFMATGNPLKCPCEMEFLLAHDYKFKIHPHRHSANCFPDDINELTNSNKNSILNISKLHRTDQFSCTSRYSKVSKPCQCNIHSSYNTMCNIPCPGPCHCFLNNRFEGQIINCTNRKLNYIPATSPIKIAVSLYVSNNALTSIGHTSLQQYSTAREMYFENNRLATIHPAAFENVPELIILNLKSNFLTQLPVGVFQNLTKMVELYLSDNRIAYLSADVFRPFISLNVLHLDNNALDSFPVWELADPHVGQLHLTLGHNPWMCECNYVNQFRIWLQNFSSRVDDASELFCASVDGTVSQIPLISFNSSHCYDMSPTFSIFQNVPLWSSFLAVLLLLILVSTLLFVYRAEVQVLVYSRYGLRIFHHHQEGDDGEKLYDAFVAFSSFDEEFVVNNLLPGLEQIENPYRICIHQRDFMVGAIITESIMEAVEKSRRTLIVLSEHFVKSGWCRFEFKSAHMKMLTDRCSRVIVIVKDDVPKDLDPEMQLYMKTNTYLKWDDHLFWQKLYFAFPDRKSKAHFPNP